MLVKLSIEEIRMLRSGESIIMKIHNSSPTDITATVEGQAWSSVGDWKVPDYIRLSYNGRVRRTDDFLLAGVSLYKNK